MNLKLTFLGGAGTVTGSKYLVETRITACWSIAGFFRASRRCACATGHRFPIDPRQIDAVLLTHAHLDHPAICRCWSSTAFAGPVFCSAATADFCRILLPDSGYLQEKDAEFANRHGFSKHKPALPLYTVAGCDPRRWSSSSRLPFDQDRRLARRGDGRWRRAGHILGAASVQLDWAGKTIVFSGDLGRYGDAIMVDPVPVEHADYLVVESTYGNRRHDPRDPEEALAEIIGGTVGRGGTVVIPAFAVGRAQSLLFHFHRLKATRPTAERPGLPRQPDGRGCERGVLQAHRGSQADRARMPAKRARSRATFAASRSRKR